MTMEKSLMKDRAGQLADLRSAVADLTDRIAEVAGSSTKQARRRAGAAAKSVSSSAGSLYDDGLEAVQSAGDHAVYYGRRATGIARQNPGLTLLGLALGVGVIAAIVYASQEDNRRWYEKPRSGWF